MILYEIKVKYARQTGEESPSAAKPELYLFEGINCTDVETRLMEYIKPYVFMGDDIEVKHCRAVQYYDVYNENGNAEEFYKMGVEFKEISESGKERIKKRNVLTRANDIDEALRLTRKEVEKLDGRVVSISKTKILDFVRLLHETPAAE